MMINEKSELGKQIASFIIMSVAVSVPAVAMSNDISNELSTDGIIIANNPVAVSPPALRYAGPEIISGQGPITVEPPVVRYAGPEYFGFTTKTPVNNVDITKPSNIPDAAQYAQFNNPVFEAGNMKDVKNDTNINNIKPNSDFVNSQYGSVRVIEQSTGHYIFK